MGKGTGLGLSISLGIIKNHQGNIEITDNVKGNNSTGSIFRIVLPVKG